MSTNTNHHPIGGGDEYLDIVTEDDANAIVSTTDELNHAIDGVSGDDVVFIDDDAVINVDNLLVKGVRPSITLASDRGVDGSE